MNGSVMSLGADLLYGACWEDLAVARAALRIPCGGLVVTIASAGDNAIGLLLDDPRQIVAVDVNPAQIALAELKVAAVRTLPGSVGQFVGGLEGGPEARQGGSGGGRGKGSGGTVASTRLDQYAGLRRLLSSDARVFWDARPDAIAGGVVHAGRFERYLAWFRRGLLPVVPGRSAVRRMLAARDPDEQQRIYRESWDTPAWRVLFRLFFSRRLLAAAGRHPAFFEHASGADVGAHYLERAIQGLTATPIRSNPYATFILSGAYRLPDAAPEYLRPVNADVLAARADRVAVWRCSLLDALHDLPANSVDAFYLSDVFELADPSAFEACLEEVARTGRPGSRVCYWNNLVERSRPQSLSDLLAPRTATAETLHAQDRAFIYSRFVVEDVLLPRSNAVAGGRVSDAA